MGLEISGIQTTLNLERALEALSLIQAEEAAFNVDLTSDVNQ